MKTLENGNRLPPPPTTTELNYFKEWEKGFTYPITQRPTEHLVGKVALEDKIDSAAVKAEYGLPLGSEEVQLLQQDQELFFDHFEE